MSVRFKFKNDLEYHSIPCDGLNISVRDLKRSIVRLNKLGKITDFDLLITNTVTGQTYTDPTHLINKNTTVTVQRLPLTDGKKKVWEEDPMMMPGGVGGGTGGSAGAGGGSTVAGGGIGGSSSSSGAMNISSMLQLGASQATEDDKLDMMMVNSTEMYREKNWTKYKGQKALPEGSKPPPNWKCAKCAQNHWATECPFINSEMKRTTGIPRSFLQPAVDRDPGAKINPQGTQYIPQFHNYFSHPSLRTNIKTGSLSLSNQTAIFIL